MHPVDRRQGSEILVAYCSETGNTAKILRAICERVLSEGHRADLMDLGDIASEAPNADGLVFLGAACYDGDLARPIKQFLEQIRR